MSVGNGHGRDRRVRGGDQMRPSADASTIAGLVFGIGATYSERTLQKRFQDIPETLADQ